MKPGDRAESALIADPGGAEQAAAGDRGSLLLRPSLLLAQRAAGPRRLSARTLGIRRQSEL